MRVCEREQYQQGPCAHRGSRRSPPPPFDHDGSAEAALCFASGASTYQIVTQRDRARLSASGSTRKPRAPICGCNWSIAPSIADFVLVDDFSGDEPRTCRSSTPIRTVTLDAAAGKPDVTVQLSADAKSADYKLYVHSARFSQQDAAALLAAMWKADQRRDRRLDRTLAGSRRAVNVRVNHPANRTAGSCPLKGNRKVPRPKIPASDIANGAVRRRADQPRDEPVGQGAGVRCRFVPITGMPRATLSRRSAG